MCETPTAGGRADKRDVLRLVVLVDRFEPVDIRPRHAFHAGDNRLDIDIVPVSFQFFSFRKNGVVFHDIAVNAVAVDLKFAERRIGCKCGDRRKRLLEFRRISGDDLRIHFIENHETLPGYLPQHFLYFLPLPQGHGALRSIFGAVRT